MSPTRSEERMAALGSLNALDDVSGASLDRLTELASHAFQAPVAFVSLVEADRQRLVSRKGLPMAQMHIRDSICAYTIGSTEVMVVPDLRLDARFASNPLVTASPHLQFYAGAPLFTKNGVAIGALCIMDKEPRSFSAEERRQLETLGTAVMNELELRALTGRRDPVSGLPNRHQFSLDYTSWAARTPNRQCYAILVDVLDVPLASEAGQVLGMAPLEALINRAGVRIKVALDGIAEVYHVGVTRFAFVVALPGREAVERLVDELQARLTRPMMAAGVPMSPLFHAGICEVQMGDDSSDDVIRKMLIGLHSAISAKAAKRWYSSKRDEALQRGYRLAADARRGLLEGEFHLVYQPRFRASDLYPVSAEALIRWNHPDFGPVSPGEFIPVFERTALMGEVSEWVIDQALTQLKRWRDDGLTLSLSINLSARDVARPGTAEGLTAKILDKGLECKDIEIEITEGEWLHAQSLPGEQLRLMATAGIKLSIDDFGSGYSNFSYLTELPVSALKLDKSLIDNVASDERSCLKVQAIIRLAKRLGYKTVAEGAESSDQVAKLRTLGCDELQGYALSQPLVPTQLVNLIRSRCPTATKLPPWYRPSQ